MLAPLSVELVHMVSYSSVLEFVFVGKAAESPIRLMRLASESKEPFTGMLKEKKEEKYNQYKIRKAMALTICLTREYFQISDVT